jgi:outer membrane protein
MTAEGFSASPELKTIDAAIAAQDRAKTSASRSLWLPDVGLQAGLRNMFSRGGAGSGSLPIPIPLPKAPDLTWQVGIQVSFAILQGGGPAAALEQSSIELDKLSLQKRSVQQGIEQRVRASLHAAGASYAGIQQARDAAEAARKNLDLVTDAYSQGAASIITLIDAQNAALVSTEAAENSVYQFLIDLMHVERAIGTFDFFRSPAEKEAYFQRLNEFYANAGEHVE